MTRIAIMTLAMLAAGCTAEFVEKRPRRNGPVPEIVLDAGGGHLRWSLRGGGWLVKSRRADALEQIAAYCGGETKYKIVDEVARVDTEARYVTDDLGESENLSKGDRHYESRTVQHLYFECEK
ncbi:MAG: hypothetical protein HY925_15025 [Elusimicrobia bacterium]|nr:hypothetical protein [Elusimicrobiota bacterium]